MYTIVQFVLIKKKLNKNFNFLVIVDELLIFNHARVEFIPQSGTKNLVQSSSDKDKSEGWPLRWWYIIAGKNESILASEILSYKKILCFQEMSHSAKFYSTEYLIWETQRKDTTPKNFN